MPTPPVFPNEPAAGERDRWLGALERTVARAREATLDLSSRPSGSREAVALRSRLLALSCEIAAMMEEPTGGHGRGAMASLRHPGAPPDHAGTPGSSAGGQTPCGSSPPPPNGTR